MLLSVVNGSWIFHGLALFFARNRNVEKQNQIRCGHYFLVVFSVEFLLRLTYTYICDSKRPFTNFCAVTQEELFLPEGRWCEPLEADDLVPQRTQIMLVVQCATATTGCHDLKRNDLFVI